MQITYYLEVVSSWCHWADPMWAGLRERYAGRVEFRWKLALMDASGLPTSVEQIEWFYRRSGLMVRSPYMLSPGWFEPGLAEYLAPNLVAEAAKDFGVEDDRARLAITHAALREGRKVGRWEVSAEVAALATGLDAAALLARARSPAVEFHALQVSQRPTFVIESAIGDKAVFSRLAVAEPLIATIEAMSRDEAGYAAHKAHFGGPPA